MLSPAVSDNGKEEEEEEEEARSRGDCVISEDGGRGSYESLMLPGAPCETSCTGDTQRGGQIRRVNCELSFIQYFT